MDAVLRIVVIYVLLMAGFRVLGKRELSNLTPFELVTLMLIPEIVSTALNANEPSLTRAMIGVGTLFTLVLATSFLAYRSRTAEKLIEAGPTVLVRDGKLVEKNLDRERVSENEILSEAHKAGLERLSQVKWAILECDGNITFIPARAEDKQIKTDSGDGPGR